MLPIVYSRKDLKSAEDYVHPEYARARDYGIDIRKFVRNTIAKKYGSIKIDKEKASLVLGGPFDDVEIVFPVQETVRPEIRAEQIETVLKRYGLNEQNTGSNVLNDHLKTSDYTVYTKTDTNKKAKGVQQNYESINRWTSEAFVGAVTPDYSPKKPYIRLLRRNDQAHGEYYIVPHMIYKDIEKYYIPDTNDDESQTLAQWNDVVSVVKSYINTAKTNSENVIGTQKLSSVERFQLAVRTAEALGLNKHGEKINFREMYYIFKPLLEDMFKSDANFSSAITNLWERNLFDHTDWGIRTRKMDADVDDKRPPILLIYEKENLSDIAELARNLNVNYWNSGGQPSATAVSEIVDRLPIGKKTHAYAVTDFDPAGLSIYLSYINHFNHAVNIRKRRERETYIDREIAKRGNKEFVKIEIEADQYVKDFDVEIVRAGLSARQLYAVNGIPLAKLGNPTGNYKSARDNALKLLSKRLNTSAIADMKPILEKEGFPRIRLKPSNWSKVGFSLKDKIGDINAGENDNKADTYATLKILPDEKRFFEDMLLLKTGALVDRIPYKEDKKDEIEALARSYAEKAKKKREVNDDDREHALSELMRRDQKSMGWGAEVEGYGPIVPDAANPYDIQLKDKRLVRHAALRATLLSSVLSPDKKWKDKPGADRVDVNTASELYKSGLLAGVGGPIGIFERTIIEKSPEYGEFKRSTDELTERTQSFYRDLLNDLYAPDPNTQKSFDTLIDTNVSSEAVLKKNHTPYLKEAFLASVEGKNLSYPFNTDSIINKMSENESVKLAAERASKHIARKSDDISEVLGLVKLILGDLRYDQAHRFIKAYPDLVKKQTTDADTLAKLLIALKFTEE